MYLKFKTTLELIQEMPRWSCSSHSLAVEWILLKEWRRELFFKQLLLSVPSLLNLWSFSLEICCYKQNTIRFSVHCLAFTGNVNASLCSNTTASLRVKSIQFYKLKFPVQLNKLKMEYMQIVRCIEMLKESQINIYFRFDLTLWCVLLTG